MRFKKLRISVGTAFIIFILIVGNIILWGELMKNKSLSEDSSNQKINVVIDNRKLDSQKVIINKRNADDKNYENYIPPSKPVVIHTRRRSRAS